MRRRGADRYPVGMVRASNLLGRIVPRESAVADSPCRGCGQTRVWKPRARRPACNPLDGWSATERDQPGCTPFQSLNACCCALALSCTRKVLNLPTCSTCLRRRRRLAGRRRHLTLDREDLNWIVRLRKESSGFLLFLFFCIVISGRHCGSSWLILLGRQWYTFKNDTLSQRNTMYGSRYILITWN